ncbi:MAG: aminopeptidase P family protein [Oscillospiraceae bacterium]|nr:aminopeptidase P family protein [Oscillospiraceae bacterium]
MNHLSQIADKLSQYDLDAMLIVSEPGERYAVGFQGEGYVLVTQEGSQYSTDGRYIEAAQKQVTGAEVVLTSRERSHLALARDFLAARGLKRVGFESAAVSVAQHRRWQESFLKGCELIPAQELLDGLRASKDEEEIAAMLQAQKITDAAFGEILNYIRPGLTEQEVAARLVYELLRRGARKVSFDPIVAAGANGSMPHAVPGETVIQKGMFVTMDFGCVYDGYCSDMTRTVAVGQPTQEMERVYETVLAAQKAGIAAARAGMPGRELDAAARKVIEEAGYGDYFTHSFGHSLGLEIHESPNASPSETRPLPVGTVISAEPGIYLPGRFGVRIEDVLVLEEGGCRDIAQSPKNLIVL